MKKGILLLLCLFFLCATSRAQSTFVKTLGGSEGEGANSAIKTNDGNFLVVGTTNSFGSGERDGFISKVNSAGKVIWDRAIGGSSDDDFKSVVQLTSGDFVIVGRTGSFSEERIDILVTRVDNLGDVVWSRTYDNLKYNFGQKVIETSDGNLLIVGHSYTGEADGLKVLVSKINQSGDEIWANSYLTNGSGVYESLGLLENNSGNYVVSAEWLEGPDSENTEAALITLSPSGDLVQFNSYDNDNFMSFNGYLKKHGAGYLNFGRTWTDNFQKRELLITNLTEDGIVNWSKALSVDVSITPTSAVLLKNGNYLVTGYLRNTNPATIDDDLLIEVTSEGEVVWAKSYGGSDYDALSAVYETDNGFLAFGTTRSYGQGGYDIFVVRTDEFGNVSGCSRDVTITSRDVNLVANSQSPIVELVSSGEPFIFGVSNTDFEENVICDGCDAADLTAGLFCEDAPIICSIDCLDGFTGTLPDEFILPQPEPLCDGGIPNNVSWFAFVAGSTTIDLSIIPTNCTTIFDDTGTSPQTIGIQAGVYEDCTFENSFICQTDGCLDLVAETINISSTEFEIGQIYYLFVDGCGGSVCDYEVVVNSAQQAFEIEEITTISNNLNLDFGQDTLCLGADITFTLDSFGQNVNFNWSIDPPTSDYPSGVHSVTDTTSVTFQFSEEGCFDIQVYAYNECDNSETRTLTVCVKTLEDEVFSDIYVCKECFPITLVSPESGCIITEGGGAPTVLIEDPNGDGVAGWFGTSMINGPGLDSNMVTNVLGCSYTQYVNVVEIPISPREIVEYYYCLTEFPVDINGFTFTFPGQSRNVTLDGAAASGCDSLMNITAHGVDFFGSSSIGNCESGEVELAFVISNVVPTSYDSITYTWYDQDANIVLDANGIDSILLVMGIGSYSVQVEVHVDSISCPQTYGPFMIDVDNLAPNIPTIAYAPLEVCVSELQAQIYVANQGLGENYIWSFTPNVPISFGLTSDTIYVDLVDGQDFEFCVHAVNGCGMSTEICDDVVVHESPDSEFQFDSEVCIDSFANIVYTGAFGTLSSSVFIWNFDGGTILNGMALNSAGPFEIGFPGPGQYTVGLILSEAGCLSVLTEHVINVVEPFNPPMIDCESSSGSVTFSWDNTGVDEVDVTVLSGQTSFELMNNTFVVDGLGSEEEVTVQIEFNAGDACGGVTITDNCTSLPCPDVELEISLSDQDICFNEGSDVTLSININGDNSGTGSWNSPFIYDDNIFSITDAGIGEHLVSYSYVIEDCTYSADTILSIFGSPEVEVDIFTSYCEDMGSNMIDIITAAENTTMLDDVLLDVLNEVEVSVGEHTVSVTSPDGCSAESTFTIEDIIVEDLIIVGDSTILKGQSNTYTAFVNSSLEDLEFIWTLNGDTICEDCFEVVISLEEESELCLFINYGEGCFLSDCMSITISERTEIYIPNIFSPNNDNINDDFTINSNNNNAFINEIMIYDRWGEMVYNQRGFNAGEDSFFWDGTINGTMCVPGVYVYLINYIDEEGQVKILSGDLTLIR